MRKILTFSLLAALIGFVTAESQAQRPIFGGSANIGTAGLLANKGVQEELKITSEQKEKLAERAKNMFGKYQEVFGKLKDVPKEERGEKMQKLLKEVQEAANKEVAEILTEDQVKRLKQIERQQNVPATLTNDEETIKALGVTDEQKEKVKAISDETSKEIAQLFQQFSKDNPRETQEKVAAARKEANEKAAKVLTDQQKSKWKELTGEPFEVKQEFGGGFFGKGKKRSTDN